MSSVAAPDQHLSLLWGGHGGPPLQVLMSSVAAPDQHLSLLWDGHGGPPLQVLTSSVAAPASVNRLVRIRGKFGRAKNSSRVPPVYRPARRRSE
jgi:hypothetical protein